MGDDARHRSVIGESAGKLQLTEFEPAHWESLLALYRCHFGDARAERFAKRWQWQYRDNPFCRELAPFIQVLLRDDKVIAHMGAFPLPLRLRGERQLAFCGADLVADPDGRMAVLQMIGRLAKKPPVFATAIHDGALGVFRHCGAQVLPISRQGYSLRLRSRGVWCRAVRSRLPAALGELCTPAFTGVLEGLSRLGQSSASIRAKPAEALDGLMVTAMDRFGKAYEEFWQRAALQCPNSLDKTAQYMNWRYVDQPWGPTLCLAAHRSNGELAGILVAEAISGFDSHGRPCGFDGEILELIVAEPELAVPLVARAVDELNGQKVDRVSAMGLSQDLGLALLEMGFTAVEEERLAASMVVATDEAFPGPLESWYWTGGDGDVLYAG